MATTPSPRPASVASSKTWVTSPKSFASMTVEPSPTAMPRALLAAMLQGLQPVAGQARHVLPRRVDAEDAALLFQSIRLLAGKYAIGH